MADFARIAIGTIDPQADLTAMSWALMESLERAGVQVQSFLSHAYFAPRDGATAITGLPPRHVDSWLMTEEVARAVFLRGARTSELAIVEGTFARSALAEASDFETLCGWLDLPRLAVVDARHLSACRMPPRPTRLDGLLLDHVADDAEFSRLQTVFEAVWKVPVVGWLGRLESLRRQIELVPPGRQPALELCQALGDELARVVRLDMIRKIAASRPWRAAAPACGERTKCAGAKALRVAVAYDDAFAGYFPDTLELLEERGARIADFSPLRDERLPPDTDVVYIGCGHPERYAAQLSKNDCLMLAIKSHLCSGRRIYAECGGLAYLCHDIEMPGGNRFPMAGVLGATAHFDPTPERPTPTEIRLASDTWLGSAGQCWRGYLSPRWRLSGTTAVEPCGCAEAGRQLDVVKRHQAVGSRVYLNFAVHGGLIDSFFTPHRAAAPGSAEQRIM
jgi:cobyrinic acid a,c-diamide synthase